MTQKLFFNSNIDTSSNKLKLSKSALTEDGLLNFEGKSFVAINELVRTNEDYYISLNIWFDTSSSESGGTGSPNNIIAGAGADMGIAWYDSSLLYYYGAGTVNKKAYEISMPSKETIHHLRVQWSELDSEIYLYVDNVIQLQKDSSLSGSISVEDYRIWVGGWDSASIQNNIKNVAIWNIDLNGEHFYKGFPNGDTSIAWVDTMGDASWNGNIYTGDPSYNFNTRNLGNNIMGGIPNKFRMGNITNI